MAPEIDLALDVLGGDPYLSVSLRVSGSGFRFPPVESESTKQALVKAALDARRELIKYSKQYRTGTPCPDGLELEDGDAVLRAFATMGRRLHEEIFGRGTGSKDLSTMSELIARTGKRDAPARLSILADLLPLPWGLLYDRKLGREGPVDVEGFWGSRFIIDRVVTAFLTRIPEVKLGVRERRAPLGVCINPHIDSEEQVSVVDAQRSFFAGLPRPLAACSVIESRDRFQEYLTEEEIGNALLYFFCHGHAAATVSEQLFLNPGTPIRDAYLKLDEKGSDRNISVEWMREVRRAPLEPGRPFVILNACSTAQGDEAFQSLFVSHFVKDWLACGLLGTEWKVPAVFADRFARDVMREFLVEGRRIGEAVQRGVVRGLEKKNPFGLIYAIYGNAQTIA
jgi:hypothetical protein